MYAATSFRRRPPVTYLRLVVTPCELVEANALVASWHRHHQPVIGHRFSLCVVDGEGVQHGAAIVGRPVSRGAGDPRKTLEVTRLVTDGTPNACSMLYAACARAGQAMGFERIQTYILSDEPGTSLRAAGWVYEGLSSGNTFRNDARPDRREDTHGKKGRWAKRLNDAQPEVLPIVSPTLPGLWDELSA